MLSGISDNVYSIYTGIKNKVEPALSHIKDTAGPILSDIKDSIIEKTKEVWEQVKPTLEGITATHWVILGSTLTLGGLAVAFIGIETIPLALAGVTIAIMLIVKNILSKNQPAFNVNQQTQPQSPAQPQLSPATPPSPANV